MGRFEGNAKKPTTGPTRIADPRRDKACLGQGFSESLGLGRIAGMDCGDRSPGIVEDFGPRRQRV